MRPIVFTCVETLGIGGEEIARRILIVSQWSDFKGYGPIPGIRSAVFEFRTTEIVGSRIRVTNTDGSSHVEEIVEWNPEKRLCLRLHQFSRPLSWLASRFEEGWEFQPSGAAMRVQRTFQMHPKSHWTRPILWVISLLLRRAIVRHLHGLGNSATPK